MDANRRRGNEDGGMSLFIATHMGLGDMILQNGLVRTLVEEHGEVFVPCIKKYERSANEMYQDDKRIVVTVVPDDIDSVNAIAKRHKKHLLLGRHNPDGHLKEGRNFDEVFYEQAGVPFENKWSKFKTVKVDTGRSFDYIFLHEDSSRGLFVDRLKIAREMPIVMPMQTGSIWDHFEHLSCAKELHLIVSCFMCVADCARLPMRKVAHLYSRPMRDPRDDITRTDDWEEVS